MDRELLDQAAENIAALANGEPPPHPEHCPSCHNYGLHPSIEQTGKCCCAQAGMWGPRLRSAKAADTGN